MSRTSGVARPAPPAGDAPVAGHAESELPHAHRRGKIGETLGDLRDAGRLGLIGGYPVGYPTRGAAQRLVPALLEGGFDLIELGVPFSDPQADGATIQRSSHVALQNGTTPADCFQVVRDLRRDGITAPILFMSYYNLILAMGLERFAGTAAACGLDGLIVPDLPPEESDELLAALGPAGIDPIFLVAPTSTDDRLSAVAARARGFIYCVSITGVTGARQQLSADLPAYLGRVRRMSELPLAVGFGISRPEHVAGLRGRADAAIVCSAIIDVIDATPAEEQATALHGFATALREAADG